MVFTVPARYAPFVAHMVQKAIEEARLDEQYRSDEDERVRQWASVADTLIDHNAIGEVAVVVAREYIPHLRKSA